MLKMVRVRSILVAM